MVPHVKYYSVFHYLMSLDLLLRQYKLHRGVVRRIREHGFRCRFPFLFYHRNNMIRMEKSNPQEDQSALCSRNDASL